ncbi:MAG: hypothetical protein ACE5OZ_02605 [Candidatus Heimdallarchaeota archaeon]
MALGSKLTIAWSKVYLKQHTIPLWLVMSIHIQDVDPHKFARFKAKAAENGLKIGEALEQAMDEWIGHQEHPLAETSQRLANVIALRRLRRTLETQHKGSWVVIANGDLKLVVPSLPELQATLGDTELPWDHAFVFQVGKPMQKRTFRC